MVMVESKAPCLDCGETFLRPKVRGRPPIRCPGCREKQLAEQTAAYVPVEIDEEKLYHGPYEALKGSRDQKPKGAESQCVRCWRIFSSDHQAESHKDYRKDPPCIDPKSLGMMAFEKRGLPIWRKPMDAETASKLYGGK